MRVHVSGLTKRFGRPAGGTKALDDVSFAVAPGEMVALLGASGSGKSTLIRHIAGLLPSDRGSVRIDDRLLQAGGRFARGTRDLRASIGVIFQQFNLVGQLSVLNNVLAGLMPRRPLWRTCSLTFNREDREAAARALAEVGLSTQALQRAGTLSGGQQQRAAIARVLLQGARLLLGDEPIASLDPRSAQRVMETIARLNRDHGVTCLISLHQVDYALAFCPRTLALAGGRVVYDGPSRALTPERLAEIYSREPDDSALPASEEPSGMPELKPQPAV